MAAFGAGWVTTHRHLAAMRRHGGFTIEVVADRRAERAREAARRFGIPRAVQAERVDELGAQVDAVTCGTAPFAHYRVVDSALEHGLPVLTEKPFTMTVAEGESLVAKARERQLPLCVVHNFQFARSVGELREWMADGRLGSVKAVRALQLSNPRRRLPEWFDELPLGLFYDESPHLIYLVRAVAGQALEPLDATVHPSTIGSARTPAQIDAQLRAGSVPVSLHMNFEAPVSEWQVLVLGDRGLAMVDIFRDIAIYAPNDGGHGALEVLRTSLSSTWRHWLGYLRSGPGHVRGRLLYGNDEVFARFHAAVRSGQPARDIDGERALEVLRLQHWILEAGGATG